LGSRGRIRRPFSSHQVTRSTTFENTSFDRPRRGAFDYPAPGQHLEGLLPTNRQRPPESLGAQGIPAACQLPRQDFAGANSYPQDRSTTHRISLHVHANPRSPPPVCRHLSVASLRPGGKRLPPGPQPTAITAWNSSPCSSGHAGAIRRCSTIRLPEGSELQGKLGAAFNSATMYARRGRRRARRCWSVLTPRWAGRFR